MKKRLIATIAITLLLMGTFVSAQDKKPDPPLCHELQTYALTHIKPVMKQKREILENELTVQEKKKVGALRIQLDAIHKTRKASNLTFCERMAGIKPNETQKEILASGRKQIRKIMIEAFSIAEKHEKAINQVSQDTRVDREKWRNDLKEIVVKHKRNTTRDFFARLEGFGVGESVRPALFLLWDPEKNY
jgi:hypothetical protein